MALHLWRWYVLFRSLYPVYPTSTLVTYIFLFPPETPTLSLSVQSFRGGTNLSCPSTVPSPRLSTFIKPYTYVRLAPRHQHPHHHRSLCLLHFSDLVLPSCHTRHLHHLSTLISQALATLLDIRRTVDSLGSSPAQKEDHGTQNSPQFPPRSLDPGQPFPEQDHCTAAVAAAAQIAAVASRRRYLRGSTTCRIYRRPIKSSKDQTIPRSQQ